MKNIFLSSSLGFAFLLLGTFAYSQDLDLIINTKEDSIACRIDSVNDTHIFFSMKSKGAWIHTNLNRSDVSEFKQNVIDRKEYIFKPGTTIIESTSSAAASIYQIRRNSVYLGLGSLMYSRMIPLNKVGITLGAGIFNFDGWGLIGESSLLVGGVKHFFEPGIMIYQFLESDKIYDDPGVNIIEEIWYTGITFRVGYRYQGPKGLLIRGGANFIYFDKSIIPGPALSLGYSF